MSEGETSTVHGLKERNQFQIPSVETKPSAMLSTTNEHRIKHNQQFVQYNINESGSIINLCLVDSIDKPRLEYIIHPTRPIQF